MASGHVNRTQRPNTWLHRPTLRREDSPCQLGAVHTWPLSTFAAAHQFGSDRRQSGSASDGCEPTLLDPSRKWRVRRSSRDKSGRSQVLVTYWTAQEAVRPRMM